MTPQDRISDAVKSFDRAAATAAAEDLAAVIRASGDRYRSDNGKTAVKRLRGARYHDAALLVAEAIFESGERDPEMRILYAQSLIVTGRLSWPRATGAGLQQKQSCDVHGDSCLLGSRPSRCQQLDREPPPRGRGI